MIDSPYNNNNREFTIKEGCPWYEAQQTYGAPNVNWCEPTVCATINEPANTWSNLGYILIGLALIKKMNEPLMRMFGLCVFVMGSLSFTYHATNNYLTQYFDFVGMFLMMSFLLAFNILRVIGSNPRQIYTLFWFLFSMNTIIFMCFDIMDIAVQKMMLMNAVPVILFDIISGFKEKRLHEYKYFFLCVLSLVAAQVFAIIDIKRIYCDPENIILHGHVIWHILGAFGMLFAGLHINKLLRYRI